MHENVAMLLNGGVKAVLIFMGMSSFAKNEMSKLPSGTASCFSGNRGSCYKHSGQAVGRVLPSCRALGRMEEQLVLHMVPCTSTPVNALQIAAPRFQGLGVALVCGC